MVDWQSRCSSFQLLLVILTLTTVADCGAQDLRGRFIWSTPSARNEADAGILYFRKSFEAGKIKSGLLEITCDDGYRAYINGQLVGSNTTWTEVIRYDISNLLLDGKNTIAIHAENASKSPAGLYCKATIQCDDQTLTVGTDKTWKQSSTAKNNWKLNKFKDSNWQNAVELGIFGNIAPWGNRFTYKTEGAVTVARKKARLKRDGWKLANGDRVVFLGGTFTERLQVNNYLETYLTIQNPSLDLKFRNLGWSGDDVFGLSRAVFGSQQDGFRRMENDLILADPTLVIVNYGLNESFRGPEYLPEFRSGLEILASLIDSNQADLCFLSPMLMENAGPPLPNPKKQNENIRLYAETIKEFAAQHGHGFIDNLVPLSESSNGDSGSIPLRNRLTENGMHLTPYGYWRLAPQLGKKIGVNSSQCSFDFDLKSKSYSLTGSTLAQIQFGQESISFSAKDDRLVYCPAPADSPRGGELMASHDFIRIAGLPSGKYGLEMNGKPTLLATAKQWQKGLWINRGKYLEQPEALRKTIHKKNEMFFHRHRPQNETYLYLFRKHEQGNNAVEIPQFDPIIANLEKEIAQQKRPQLITYQVKKLSND